MDNVIQRALILHTGSVIQAADLQLLTEDQTSVLVMNDSESSTDAVDEVNIYDKTLLKSTKKHEYDVIYKVLKECISNRKIVANKLNISERTLRYKLAQMRKEGYDI